MKFDYAVLKQDDIKKGLHPTTQELKAFYDSHQKSYANSIPEKRKVKYVHARHSEGRRPKCRSRSDELQAYYNQHRDQYRVAGAGEGQPHSDQDAVARARRQE